MNCTTRNNWFPTKVECLAAVVRPRWESIKKNFDVKLGIWAFTIIENANMLLEHQ